MAKGKYQKWLEPDGLLLLSAWARDGLTNEQIADKLGVAVGTLYVWINEYPEISEALKKGKEVIDTEVENALLKSSLGYEYDEITWERRKAGADENGIPEYAMLETKRVRKYAPPNIAALIFWLKNRKPAEWRDKPVSNEAASELLEKAREMLEGVPSAF